LLQGGFTFDYPLLRPAFEDLLRHYRGIRR
jgi:hypothetical protein